MSSKNVGAKSIPNDHYPTPEHAVVRLYEACRHVSGAKILMSTTEWLDTFVADVRKAWRKKGWIGR